MLHACCNQVAVASSSLRHGKLSIFVLKSQPALSSYIHSWSYVEVILPSFHQTPRGPGDTPELRRQLAHLMRRGCVRPVLKEQKTRDTNADSEPISNAFESVLCIEKGATKRTWRGSHFLGNRVKKTMFLPISDCLMWTSHAGTNQTLKIPQDRDQTRVKGQRIV